LSCKFVIKSKVLTFYIKFVQHFVQSDAEMLLHWYQITRL